MKEFAKSFASLSLGMSILSLQILAEMLAPNQEHEPKGAATRALDSVTDATIDQLGPMLRATFRALDNVQRGMTAIAFDSLLHALRDESNEPRHPTRGRGAHSRALDRRERAATPEQKNTRDVTENHPPVAVKVSRQW